MANGPVEVAGTFIDAMKAQPLSLALVVMNLGLLGFLYYEGVQAHSERQAEMKMMYENRAEVAKLLAACYPGPQR
jgi:hypothetical protein